VVRRARWKWTAAILAPLALTLAPAAVQAAAPTCDDMNMGVPHNAVTPIFIACSGGSGVGAPDVLIATNPTKGTLNPVAGGTSTDQWVVYTPNAGQSGADSFTYRGVSPGSGAGGSDEVGPLRTVNLRIGAGTPPACMNLSQSVPQNDATHTTPTSLRLVCASGGDPIVSYSISNPPDHGLLTTTSLSSGLVGYTSNTGYAGADSFGYRATSTCGAASCQSAEAIFDLTVLDPQQGPEGPTGPQGPQGPIGPAGQDGATGATGAAGQNGATGAIGAQGPAGPNGKDGQAVSVDRLVIASFLDALTVRRGRTVMLRYVSTTSARVVLEVFKGSRRVAAISGRAREGRNAIRWNGKVRGKAAAAGLYRLLLRATSGEQLVTDRASIRIIRSKRAAKRPSGGAQKPGQPVSGGGETG
jgi:hypothetical protein